MLGSRPYLPPPAARHTASCPTYRPTHLAYRPTGPYLVLIEKYETQPPHDDSVTFTTEDTAHRVRDGQISLDARESIAEVR